MGINGINYNPYLYTGIEAANNSLKNAATESSAYSTNKNNGDTFELVQKIDTAKLRNELEETKSKQGLIGKLWDGFKNLTGIGAGSSKAEKLIEDFENGKISQEEMNKAISKYQQGQKQCVDMVADIASGIAAFGAFALATGVGIVASPFTGGASLGLVAAGFGIAGVAGAGVKVGIKGIDCAVGGRKYDSLGYDIATGGINGMFAPITAGIGGAAGKAVAGKIGVTALREGGEVAVKKALVGTTRGALAKTLLTTNVKYVGGTFASRALALGTDMAVNGAITSAVDSGTRYLAGDSENKSLEGFAKVVGEGTLGGLIMAPLIGGSMRLAGNGIGKLTGKLQTKVSTNYSKAKSAMMNTPVVDNPDMEVARELGGVIKQVQGLIDDVQIKGSDLLDGLDRNLFDLSDNISGIIKNASTFNAEIDAMSRKNRALVIEILKEISEGKDVSSKVVELTQKGISFTDMVDSKIGVFSSELEEKFAKVMAANETLTQKAAKGIDLASQTLDNASDIVNAAVKQARKIPKTKTYKQLGDLPDRVKALYSSLSSDASALDNAAQAARKKILAGDVQDGLEDLVRYYNEVDVFNAKLEQQISSMQSSAARSGIEESTDILRERLAGLTLSSDFQNMTRQEQIQTLIEAVKKSGIEEGSALKERLTKLTNSADFRNMTGEEQIQALKGAVKSGFGESLDTLKERLTRLTLSEDFQHMTGEEQIQALLENSNILLSKFAQTFSSNDSLPPNIQKIFKQFTSNCTVSRNMTQAQNLADELYGVGKYTIKKSFGAGTIGETYLAQTADGAEVVIKMLKEGVTPKKFAQDRAMLTRYINEFVTDSAEKEYKLNLINNMFDAWDRELNFGLEAQGAKTMADGAKRFSVAQTLEVGSRNGQNISLVMEKANGVKLDSLLEMIKLYKENPAEYFTKYAKEIEANPALKTPENWVSDLGRVYQKAQNEQTMFVGQSGIRTIHADPHPGNVFVDFDPTTSKPKIVYIDTGNVIQRTTSQTLQDIGLSLNMLVGNSKGIADAMLDGAILPKGASKAEIAEKFAQLLDERLYQAGVNLKSTQYTQNTINGILKELNIIPNSGNSNLMKAALQRIETSRAINGVCGTTSSKVVNIKDMGIGIIKSFKVNPKETWQTIKPIIKWAYQNNDQAMLTFFQMIIKKAGVQPPTIIS